MVQLTVLEGLESTKVGKVWQQEHGAELAVREQGDHIFSPYKHGEKKKWSQAVKAHSLPTLRCTSVSKAPPPKGSITFPNSATSRD